MGMGMDNNRVSAAKPGAATVMIAFRCFYDEKDDNCNDNNSNNRE